MDTAATWLRWTRAGTLASVATFLATAAHVHADGHAPSLPVVLFLVLGLTAASATLLARPASALRVVLLTVGGQLVAHSVLAAASTHAAGGSLAPAMSGGMPATTGPHTAHVVEQGAAGIVPGSVPLLTQLLGLDARMVAAHLAAAVLVGLWLAAGERAVWSLLTHVWRALCLPALLLPSTPVTRGAPAQQQTGLTLARLGSGTVVRRGPPHLLAA